MKPSESIRQDADNLKQLNFDDNLDSVSDHLAGFQAYIAEQHFMLEAILRYLDEQAEEEK